MLLDPIAIEWNRAELLRYLGYRDAKTKDRILSEEIERELQRGQSRVQPKGIYCIYPMVRSEPRQLDLGDAKVQGQVATFLARADRIAVFVVTVGQGISDCSRSASDSGDPVTAWTLDALGSYAAEAAAEALLKSLRVEFPAAGALSPRYSPGYCGMHLKQQSALFSLVDAGVIGVTLLSSMLMQPTKSISGIIGIGRAGTFTVGSSPCERCDDFDCAMRR